MYAFSPVRCSPVGWMALCLVWLTGCGAASTPETVFTTWANSVKSGNFRGSWECLTPQARGTVLQIMMLDAELLSGAIPNAKNSFNQVFVKHGLNPEDPGFAQQRLSVSDPAELAADLNNVFREFHAELEKRPANRFAKLNAIWTASAQSALGPSKTEGTRATAALQGKIPHTPENATVQATFEKVNSRWLFAELEPVAGSPAVPGGPAGMAGAAIPGGAMPGMPPGAAVPPPGAAAAQIAMAGRPGGAAEAPTGQLPPEDPDSAIPPGGPANLAPGAINPRRMQMRPQAGAAANPGAMPANPKVTAGDPPEEAPGAPAEGRPGLGVGGALKAMPARPGDPAIDRPAMLNPRNEDGAIGAGGAGRNGGIGAQKRESQFKQGSLEYAVTEFVAKIADGDYAAMDYLVSTRAKGLLSEIRDGEISEEKRDELKATFANASPQENSRKNKGNMVELYLKGKLGHTIQLSVGKEDGVFKIRELKIHEPGATKKR